MCGWERRQPLGMGYRILLAIECWTSRDLKNLQVSPELAHMEPEVLLETAVVICIINGKFGHVPLAPRGVAGEKWTLSCAPQGWQGPPPTTHSLRDCECGTASSLLSPRGGYRFC